MERLETEPRLELDVIRGAQPRVGAAQALARGRGVAFGPAQPVAVGGVGGVDLGEGLAGGGLARRGRWRSRRAGRRAPRRSDALALAERRERRASARAIRSLGQGRGLPRRGPAGSRRRGARRRARRLLGEAIATGAQLGGPSLPGRQRGPGRPIRRAGGRRVGAVTSGASARASRRAAAGAIQLGGESLRLGLVPRRLADDRLEPSRDQAFGLLGRSPGALGPALLGAGRLDRIGRRRRRGGQP